ncbi:MAG: NUDIX domain-containing protein [Longimicrobiales bacterium]
MPQTWDGKPIATEPPFGATVMVYRTTSSGREFLLLHRAHRGLEYEGDWAWTPPAGARYPNEPIEACALRELREEAGLQATLRRLDHPPRDWAIFHREESNGL